MRWSFFQPLLLWALALCAIPVIVHLLFRRRATRVTFSSLRFFQETAVRTSRRRRLRRILLLAVRTLIAACAVVLFAQPFDAASPFAVLHDPQVSVCVWIDPTVSMEYRVRKVPLYQRAADLVDSLAASLAPGADILVFHERTATFERRREGRGADPQVRHGPSTAGRALEAFSQLPGTRRILVMLSDFQSVPLESGRTVAEAVERTVARGAGSAPVCCVNLLPRDPWNVTVASARVAPESRGVLVATLKVRGRNPGRLRLSAEQDGLRTGSAEFHAGRDATAEVRISVAEEGGGAEAGVVRLESDDPFPPDNFCYFTRQQSRTFRVLITGEAPKCEPVAAAFRSLDSAVWRPVRMIDYQELSADDIDSADLLVLNAVPEATQPLAQVVSGWGYGDKPVIFAPSTDSLRQEFTRLVGGKILKLRDMRMRTADPGRTLVLSDTVSALWTGFPRQSDMDVRAIRYWVLSGANVLARLDNNDPFVLEVRREGAPWIMVATDAGFSDGNNLCASGFYVPFLDRIARRAVAGASRSVDWRAGVPSTNPQYGTGVPAQVWDAGGRLVAHWERQPSVVLDLPGSYLVKSQDKPSYPIAANIDTAECRFSQKLPNAAGNNRLKVVDEDGFLRLVRPQHSAAWALWALLAILVLAEMALWLPAYGRSSGRH